MKKIEITKTLKFASDCRTILPLDKGQIITLGESGLNRDNFARLIELEVAHVLEVADIPVAEEPKVVDFREITDKDELEAFAREHYSVELDRRQSREKMIATLEKAIAKQGE